MTLLVGDNVEGCTQEEEDVVGGREGGGGYGGGVGGGVVADKVKVIVTSSEEGLCSTRLLLVVVSSPEEGMPAVRRAGLLSREEGDGGRRGERHGMTIWKGMRKGLIISRKGE
jgi:hypothetical protein